MHKVFVYGSLKQGGHNHYFLSQSSFIGRCRTEPAYELFTLGSFPCVVSGGTTSVQGEVYEVDNSTLEKLDELEGHPDWYQREQITTVYGAAYLYLYLGDVGHCSKIVSGEWIIPAIDNN
ncbi:gamma-glutamylcyclotransferase [Oceanicoccus sp. KOV_DT_Chl]|uniref:gamma-glutamylcyclotransferase family protein n=1 Tax=Oceanicoccus sp. KOV_DT_Chl TaxID=1904639 RepID=UPI000C7A0B87|nr:gamma-glutamylcyclotransferase family protein [Oceanicoccus sp. KOV_DT_Chl]